MAIVQISRITNRRGITENLPQLAGAELGWCYDSRRLFIGNGTLQDGAPVIGNTEILTEFSDITVLSNYTYEDIAVGYAVQTGANPNSPIVRSVQARLDDYVSVRAFGAVGDGQTDDTDAINRALFQLYCIDTNTQVRRTLFFPAGTYRVTNTILIPTYAKLVGEGSDGSTILLDTQGDSSVPDYVARSADSLQQIGGAIGSNGAVPPRDIEISCMAFSTVDDTNIFFVQAAQNCWFNRVNFRGPVTVDDLLDSGFNPGITNVSGISLASLPENSSAPATRCSDIVFDACGFFNSTYGIETNQYARSVTVTNCSFDVLYQGIVLSTYATGCRTVHNSFDQIYAEGIVYSNVSLNVSAYNVFYNVGQHISSGPITPVISFTNDNNVSVGDMFQRSYAQNNIVPSVEISGNDTAIGSSQTRLGRLVIQNGLSQSLTANTTNATLVTVNTNDVKAFDLDYRILRSVSGATCIRKGTMTVVAGPTDDSSSDSAWSDDYVENFDTEIVLDVSQSGDNINVRFTSSAGDPATIYYSLNYLA